MMVKTAEGGDNREVVGASNGKPENSEQRLPTSWLWKSDDGPGCVGPCIASDMGHGPQETSDLRQSGSLTGLDD